MLSQINFLFCFKQTQSPAETITLWPEGATDNLTSSQETKQESEDLIFSVFWDLPETKSPHSLCSSHFLCSFHCQTALIHITHKKKKKKELSFSLGAHYIIKPSSSTVTMSDVWGRCWWCRSLCPKYSLNICINWNKRTVYLILRQRTSLCWEAQHIQWATRSKLFHRLYNTTGIKKDVFIRNTHSLLRFNKVFS